ncbi:hypothetical protein [Methanooceanicella nereidis]|uniref:hypothetical protein n=1 Tax=Methanooceanicella nereidis TaxID=2052831 RepID=UPI001E2F3E30|nr:hypothetical protein [Methanocella sp. CWC-04]
MNGILLIRPAAIPHKIAAYTRSIQKNLSTFAIKMMMTSGRPNSMRRFSLHSVLVDAHKLFASPMLGNECIANDIPNQIKIPLRIVLMLKAAIINTNNENRLLMMNGAVVIKKDSL